jgi:hypothetical protein
MTPAFGFSVGDFISNIGKWFATLLQVVILSIAAALGKKVSEALKATGGASCEYRHVIIELEGLKMCYGTWRRWSQRRTISAMSMQFVIWRLRAVHRSNPFPTNSKSMRRQ